SRRRARRARPAPPCPYTTLFRSLLDTGVGLQSIRTAVDHLRSRGVEDLSQITLMSDGASVFECTSPDEVVDLLQGGQGVFGIAVGRVWNEVEGTLSELPRERLPEDDAAIATMHALAARRARKLGSAHGSSPRSPRRSVHRTGRLLHSRGSAPLPDVEETWPLMPD